MFVTNDPDIEKITAHKYFKMKFRQEILRHLVSMINIVRFVEETLKIVNILYRSCQKLF